MKPLSEYIVGIMEAEEKVFPYKLLLKLKDILPHRYDAHGATSTTVGVKYKSKIYGIFWQEDLWDNDFGGHVGVTLDGKHEIKNKTIAYNVAMEYIKRKGIKE